LLNPGKLSFGKRKGVYSTPEERKREGFVSILVREKRKGNDLHEVEREAFSFIIQGREECASSAKGEGIGRDTRPGSG